MGDGGRACSRNTHTKTGKCVKKWDVGAGVKDVRLIEDSEAKSQFVVTSADKEQLELWTARGGKKLAEVVVERGS